MPRMFYLLLLQWSPCERPIAEFGSLWFISETLIDCGLSQIALTYNQFEKNPTGQNSDGDFETIRMMERENVHLER